MISKTIGFRGLAYFQTNPYGKILEKSWDNVLFLCFKGIFFSGEFLEMDEIWDLGGDIPGVQNFHGENDGKMGWQNLFDSSPLLVDILPEQRMNVVTSLVRKMVILPNDYPLVI